MSKHLFARGRHLPADLSRRAFLTGMAVATAAAGAPRLALAQTVGVPPAASGPVLLTNFRLFDGTSPDLRDGMRVLVDGNRIAAVESGDTPPPPGTETIDCGGRVLMPGLIDAHWHATLAAVPLQTLIAAKAGYIHLAAGAEAERTLMRGFTTIRDLAGPSFSLKKTIDEGLVAGPRIFPSGAMISQTSGHGDFRMPYEIPSSGDELSEPEIKGAVAIADSPDEVRLRTREQLMLGASQIKLAAGGGVSSLHDPLDSLQFRPEEIRAAVEAAADWGTYVTVHVYTPAGIKRSLSAGVRCIDHGQLADEDAVRMIVDKDAWWSLQPFTADIDVNTFTDPRKRASQQTVHEGTDNAYRLAIEHGAKVAWGTDILFDPEATARQGAILAAMQRWYSPVDVLRMATSRNAELLAMSGPRAPYSGRLGVIAADALADLLVVEGDPIGNLDLLADPETNLRLIMKDGRIHKNAL